MTNVGSAAAAAQASIGNVVLGSTFAILQSAGAGGAGIAVVNTVVGATATAVAVGATAPGLVKAVREGREGGQHGEEVEDVLPEEEAPHGSGDNTALEGKL